MEPENTESGHAVTQLLVKASNGSDAAREALFPLVSERLRSLAERAFSSERKGHTLGVTAIVHDAYMELVESSVTWSGRRQFFAIAGAAMSQILTRHARTKGRQKRGGGRTRVTLGDLRLSQSTDELDLLELGEALERLRQKWPRMADLVEQRFFCGLSVSEAADVIGLGKRTAEKDWRFARTWLWRELGGADEA